MQEQQQQRLRLLEGRVLQRRRQLLARQQVLQLQPAEPRQRLLRVQLQRQHWLQEQLMQRWQRLQARQQEQLWWQGEAAWRRWVWQQARLPSCKEARLRYRLLQQEQL